MTEKADTQNTMLVSFMDGHTLNTLILDLCDFDVMEDVEGNIHLKIHSKIPLPPFTNGDFYLCVSDDPFMSWAGDWTHLGCFRIRIEMKNASLIGDEVVCKNEDFKRDALLPDRRIYDRTKNIPKLSFW